LKSFLEICTFYCYEDLGRPIIFGEIFFEYFFILSISFNEEKSDFAFFKNLLTCCVI